MHVTVVGGYGRGISFFVDQAPHGGETRSHARLLETHGGKGSNQAVGTARLGAPVYLVTAIADDAGGTMGRELWRTEHVDATGVRVLEGSTMTGAIITDASAENRIVIADGVLGEISPADIDAVADVFTGATVVLVSCEIAAPAAGRALRLGHDAGALTILNPAPVPDLEHIDFTCVGVLTPNQSEAALLLGLAPDDMGRPEEVVDALRARYDVTVVMTLGDDGAVAAPRAGGILRVPAYRPSRVVDTTGAGDSFNAGLAVGLFHGLDLPDAMRLGAVCGGLAVTERGVIPALPSRSAVVAALLDAGEHDLAAALPD